MKASVIIPSWNRRTNLLRTLKALSEQQLVEHTFEIIVVDDNSTDETGIAILKNMADKLPNLKYIYRNGRKGWNASVPRNLGAHASNMDSDVLIFLDSDILLPPDRLQKYLNDYAADPDPKRVIIGPYHYLTSELDTDIGTWYLNDIQGYQGDIRWNSFLEHPVGEKNVGVGFALACFGGSLLIPRRLFFKTGGYDETVVSGCEDGDFGLTLWESGAVFSMDQGLLGWHQPHEIVAERTSQIPEMVKYLDEKHHMDLIKESGKAHRMWNKDWIVPDIWLESGGYTREEFEKEISK